MSEFYEDCRDVLPRLDSGSVPRRASRRPLIGRSVTTARRGR